MLANRITALVLIFAAASLAWFFLGRTIVERTQLSYSTLNSQVEQLAGQPINQRAPFVRDSAGKAVDLHSSTIGTTLDLDYRRKGLLWYPVYNVDFSAAYTVVNSATDTKNFMVYLPFPAAKGTLENFEFSVNGNDNWTPEATWAKLPVTLGGQQQAKIAVHYRTRGLRNWSYTLDDTVQHVRNFSLKVSSDTPDIDFPNGTLSPTERTLKEFTWKYNNRLSGFIIGVEMPEKLNPGDVASRISFFAPLGLLFFFIVLSTSCLIKKVNLHPMHFLFLAAGFFAFHLLFTYLVDHVAVFPAFLISSAVSLLLVGNYMRLVTGIRFALAPSALAQFVYLILFSYAFFFKGYTGLTITIGAVITLGVLMQLTAKVDWEAAFTANNQKKPIPPQPIPVVSSPSTEANRGAGETK